MDRHCRCPAEAWSHCSRGYSGCSRCLTALGIQATCAIFKCFSADAACVLPGEAWLTFVTPTEALRSVRDLNRHYLGNRYLELSIC
jgi:hypothetical protein